MILNDYGNNNHINASRYLYSSFKILFALSYHNYTSMLYLCTQNHKIVIIEQLNQNTQFSSEKFSLNLLFYHHSIIV